MSNSNVAFPCIGRCCKLTLDIPGYMRNSFYSSILILLDFSLTVNAATLIFISGRGSAIPSAKEGKSGFIYNLVKS